VIECSLSYLDIFPDFIFRIMTDSYPIYKCSKEITLKLKNKRSVFVEIEEIVNDNFSERSDRETISVPIPYHKYLAWGALVC
jgi:hypothetical protein